MSPGPPSALLDVKERIAAACSRVGRDPAAVTLVAVTKGRTPDDVRALLAAGHDVLAENRVQDWRALVDALGDVPGDTPPQWHLIGHLQRNKARFCRPFTLIHSLDSERLARALDDEGAKHDHVFRTLLQVNVSGEESKFGVATVDVEALLDRVAVLPHVEVAGLMTIAPYHDDPELARPVFAGLRELARRLGLIELSMGMSGDFEVAIEEGATLVRIGSALFESASAAPANEAQPDGASTESTASTASTESTST